ncbi:MAG: hypothetical protein HY730_04425 [Candidatus Tectomicrobia bacterium]|uniref:Uncharacterized protein n=1 Tax=Tectimicrobiota bacterium TaxID=2528274 RepID=A0A933GKM8_UNCTE|nr:hypothetical protein [Candidatus Tectomicrobia bacterium]
MKIRFLAISLVLSALIVLILMVTSVVDIPFWPSQPAIEKSPGKTDLSQLPATPTKSERGPETTPPKVSPEGVKPKPAPYETTKPQEETAASNIGRLDNIVGLDTPIPLTAKKTDNKPESKPLRESKVAKEITPESETKSRESLRLEEKKEKKQEADSVTTLREIFKGSGIKEVPEGRYFVHTVRPGENLWVIIQGYLIRKYAESDLRIGKYDDEVLAGGLSSPFGLEVFLKERKVYLYNFQKNNMSKDINRLYPYQQIVILKDLIYEDLLLLTKGR